MKRLVDQIGDIPANCFNYGSYHDGFFQARDEATMIASRWQRYIDKLEYVAKAAIGQSMGDNVIENMRKEYLY